MSIIANATLRLSLDEEMELALAKAELEFPGLKPTQIIRTVFLRTINSRTSNRNVLGQIANELDQYPTSKEPLEDEEYQAWWNSRKSSLSKSKI